ncbi:hypothetical protein H4W27_000088 [Nesterenkonia lutea]|uniref:Uncharacterized protein n=1 Tax=Nesterenkonia lutea TaxID=272919 RepID=A0ABR9JAL0_9MICC|nr:hypothetical protein [Nesterenkonia lutea]
MFTCDSNAYVHQLTHGQRERQRRQDEELAHSQPSNNRFHQLFCLSGGPMFSGGTSRTGQGQPKQLTRRQATVYIE